MANFSVNCPFLFPNFAPTWWKKLGSKAATSSSMGTLAASQQDVNLKNMNKQILIILVLILSSAKLVAQEKFKLSYSGFFQDHLENWPKLQFELINLTNDTLYISYDNIKFEVRKNSKKVEEEKPKLGIGTPFIRPKLEECPEKQVERKRLAQKFAEKLVAENNVAEKDKQDAIQEVETACIVIYPKEILYEYKTFFHRQFDRNYEVNVKPYNDEIFTSYESDSNGLIRIKK